MSPKGETMVHPLACWIFLFFQLALLGFLKADTGGQRMARSALLVSRDRGDDVGTQRMARRQPRDDDEFWIHAEKGGSPMDPKGMKKDLNDYGHRGNHDMDPSFHIFFTLEDLKIGKTMLLYFPQKPDPSKTPRLLPRDEAESIPFSSSQLSSLLDYFSFSESSAQAKAMKYTLEQCELEPIQGEFKFCATSLEEMLDRAHQIFGPGTESRALTTTYVSMTKTAKPLQNYTVLETPKQIAAPRMMGCHPMPYPYAVFYCHSQQRNENKLFQVSLGGPDGERIEAVSVCHMDTSQWDRDHVSFRVLHIKPGSSPVCHFFPVDNLVWVPVRSPYVNVEPPYGH